MSDDQTPDPASANRLRLSEQRAEIKRLRGVIEQMREVLEQAQSCILGDDCDNPAEARSDTLQKIKEALNVR